MRSFAIGTMNGFSTNLVFPIFAKPFCNKSEFLSLYIERKKNQQSSLDFLP